MPHTLLSDEIYVQGMNKVSLWGKGQKGWGPAVQPKGQMLQGVGPGGAGRGHLIGIYSQAHNE